MSFLQGTTYSIVLAFAQRTLTFTSNQLLLRSVNPEIFGLATIQFEFVLNSILFISREGIRGTLLRIDSSKPNKIRRIPFYLGILLSILAFSLLKFTATEEAKYQIGYNECLLLYAISIPIELITEPKRVLYLQPNYSQQRAKIEGLSIIVKSFTVFIGVFFRLGLISYGIGQLFFAISLLALYGTGNQLVKSKEPLNEDVKSLALTLSAQGVVKQFLTEGDKLILSQVANLKDQGGYALAENYGSLITRIIFLPIEENCRVYFSKADIDSSSKYLHLLVKGNILFASIIISIGPAFTQTFLSILAPKFLNTSAASLLRVYCCYLPLLGVNGVLEAYLQSTARSSQLGSATKVMILWSLIYAVAAWFFVSYLSWTTGLLWANCVNMACRILYATSYAQLDFSKITPSYTSISTAILMSLAVRYTMESSPIVHLLNGTFCGLTLLGVIVFKEQKSVMHEIKVVKQGI